MNVGQSSEVFDSQLWCCGGEKNTAGVLVRTAVWPLIQTNDCGVFNLWVIPGLKDICASILLISKPIISCFTAAYLSEGNKLSEAGLAHLTDHVI